MKPTLYVPIPVYNGAKTIRRTLHNLTQQTYRDFQIMVYDDGSTDTTAEIVGQYAEKDPRVILLSGERNVGRGAARNRLLTACKGGLIAWQDADDSWNPQKLQLQMAYFNQLVAAGADRDRTIIISTFRRLSSHQEGDKVTKHPPPEKYDIAYVFSDDYRTCPFQLQATLGPADAYLNAGGFDEHLNWSEDFDVALKLLSSGVTIATHREEKPLATYHHSFSGAKGDVVERSQNVIRDRHRDYARSVGIDIDDVFTRRRLTYLFNIYLTNKNFAKALAVSLSAIPGADEKTTMRISRNVMGVFEAMMAKKNAPPLASQMKGEA